MLFLMENYMRFGEVNILVCNIMLRNVREDTVKSLNARVNNWKPQIHHNYPWSYRHVREYI